MAAVLGGVVGEFDRGAAERVGGFASKPGIVARGEGEVTLGNRRAGAGGVKPGNRAAGGARGEARESAG